MMRYFEHLISSASGADSLHDGDPAQLTIMLHLQICAEQQVLLANTNGEDD